MIQSERFLDPPAPFRKGGVLTACRVRSEGTALERDDLAQYLAEWKSGDNTARDALVALVYDELRRLAAGYLRGERSAITLQPTMLVHETYLRMVAQRLPDVETRAHFFGVAAHLMRQILVDHARRNGRGKRGGGDRPAPLEEALHSTPMRDSQLPALDDALNALAEVDARKCQIVELRYFGGFTIDETAEALGISVATVAREQRLAEAWLHRQMTVAAPACA